MSSGFSTARFVHALQPPLRRTGLDGLDHTRFVGTWTDDGYPNARLTIGFEAFTTRRGRADHGRIVDHGIGNRSRCRLAVASVPGGADGPRRLGKAAFGHEAVV